MRARGSLTEAVFHGQGQIESTAAPATESKSSVSSTEAPTSRPSCLTRKDFMAYARKALVFRPDTYDSITQFARSPLVQ